MENPDITSNHLEDAEADKIRSENPDVPPESTVVSKSTSDEPAINIDHGTDSKTTVETMAADSDDKKENNVDAGAANLKVEESGEVQEESGESNDSAVPIEKDGGREGVKLPSTEESKKGMLSPSDQPTTTLSNDGTQSAPTSPEKDITLTGSESQSNKEKEAKSPETVVKEEDIVSMDVDSSEANDPDPPIEESIKTPAETSNVNTTTTYSTRGRSTEATFVEEKPERLNIRDTFEESPRPKDPPSGVSFLVEAMTEEERRTRTRFLPDVDGMHMLRKNEIKDDLALASSLPSIVSPSGTLQTRTGRLGASGRNSDSMDVDNDEVIHAINDKNTTTIELPSSSLTIPSDTFIAPKGVVVGETETTIEVKEFEQAAQSPSKVDSVVSFNPPRPPESVGGKKKHRMIRWERRPEDIEVDMKNYRRTVQRTRQELQKSEAEYDRLEMIDSHLRHHFLNHAELLDREFAYLQDQLEIEVENLINESDLVGSRTRSRSLTKVDVVMRDVLTMLTRNEQKDISTDGQGKEERVSHNMSPGIGGLNVQAFTDWERSTELQSMNPCISWIEPGQRVTTPCGEGTVIEVIPPESPPTNDSLRNSGKENGNKDEVTKKSKMSEEELNHIQDKNKYDCLLPLRFKVRLGYGTGYFVGSSILKIESPAHFTDAELAKRWKGMINSALEVGTCIDLQGMLPTVEKIGEGIFGDDQKENKDAKDIGASATSNGTTSTEKTDGDFLRIGSSLIPTKFGRGNFLHNMEIRDIEETLQNVLYDGHGVLGRKSNPGVTGDVRKWEDDEQEYLDLRASVLQLKNALYRQRRIRILNERTTSSINDRYLRAEELVSEMRSDLKSLKRRLGDELKELGITDGMANQILSQFYKGHQEEDQGNTSTPKRLRRASSMIGEMLTDIDVGSDRREGDSRDSMDDQGTDDLSGDDLEARRPAKKIRSSA